MSWKVTFRARLGMCDGMGREIDVGVDFGEE